MHVHHTLIKQRRLELALTQDHVARVVGIDVRTLRHYESDAVALTRAEQRPIVAALAQVLEVSLDDLLVEDAPEPSDQDGYVHRRVQEALALELLRRRGQPVVIDAPKDHGKARMVQSLAATFQERSEGRALRVRMSLYSDAEVSDTGVFFQRVALDLLRGAQVPEPEGRLAALWNPGLPEQRRLDQLLYSELLKDTRPLLLCFESLDRLWGQPTLGALLRLLRSWVDEEDGALAHLRLLVTTAVRTDWIDQREHSPFLSCCTRLELPPFNARELSELLEMHRIAATPAAVEALQQVVGGHPRLSCELVSWASCAGAPLEVSLADQGFVDNALNGQRRAKLRWLQKNSLLKAFRQMLREPRTPLSEEDAARLYSQGLLDEAERGVFVCRYPVFAQHLTDLS